MEVATEMSSSMFEPKTAKKVYLYRNGVINADPKCLIVNQRQVRDFGSFLNRVTSGLKAPVAIRNIYTPAGGHKVKSLDSLESGRYYVAGGSEQFKRIKYGGSSPQKLLSRRPPRKEFSVPSRMQQAVVASSRYKKPVEKPFIIHVFRNGDFRYQGARVLLPRRIMGSWEHVLEIVTEKADLFTPAKRLCTLDGHIVHAVSELQDGGKYVVLEGSKPFQRVPYCTTGDDSRSLMHTFPKAAIRLHRRPRRKPTQNDDGMISDPGKTPVPLLSQSLKQQRLERRKSRPMAGRKNKEAREKAIEDHRADSIFGGSPTRELEVPFTTSMKQGTSPTAQHPLSKVSTVAKDTSSSEDTDTFDATVAERKPAVFHAADNGKQKETKQEYIEETQGDALFKAKSQRADVEDAEVVVESHDTEVERPLDLEEAEEVEEEKGEEFEKEGEADNKVSELQAPPQHTSIDLSLNRTQPTTTTTTTVDSNATTTEHTDSDTLPAEGIANNDPKPSTGSGARSAQSSRHSQAIDDSNNEASIKPEEGEESQHQVQGDNEKEGEEKASGTEPESTTKDDNVADGGAGNGEVANPPEEETIEEDVTETKDKEEKSSHDDDKETSEATKDTAVEEVSEELEQQEPPPSSPPAGEPEAVEPQLTEGSSGGGEEGAVVESTTEPLDTSVPEEIVEEVDRSGQDDDTGSQKEDELTTTFVVEDHQDS